MSNKTPKTFEEISNTSGHRHHLTTANELSKFGWTLLVGPRYFDQRQNRWSEIDIVAEKQVVEYKEGQLTCRLVIECKYLASRQVAWYQPVDEDIFLQYATRFFPAQFEPNIMSNSRGDVQDAIQSLKMGAEIVSLFDEDGDSYLLKGVQQSIAAAENFSSRRPLTKNLGQRWAKDNKLNLTWTLPVLVVNAFDNIGKIRGGVVEQVSEEFLAAFPERNDQGDMTYVTSVVMTPNHVSLLDRTVSSWATKVSGVVNQLME